MLCNFKTFLILLAAVLLAGCAGQGQAVVQKGVEGVEAKSNLTWSATEKAICANSVGGMLRNATPEQVAWIVEWCSQYYGGQGLVETSPLANAPQVSSESLSE